MDGFYYAETNKNFTIETAFSDDGVQITDPTIYLKVTSILFIRAGLFLSQISSIPSCNIQVLIFQNIIDISVNTVIYALMGHVFAFGSDTGSFIGTEGFLDDKIDRNEFAEGWLIVIAVSGFVVAAIGDRISFFSSLIINIFISGLVFPMIIHWILSQWGWMRFHTLSRVRVSYKDYSYSCLIHMSGGFLACISMLILNRRLLRFKDLDVCAIPDNGPSLSLFGNFLLIIGFFGIGVPTKEYIYSHLNFNSYGTVLINTLLSAFSSAMSTLLLTFSCPCEPLHKWTSLRSMQAVVSGIAVVAGGADVYYPTAALLIGFCNGFMFFWMSFLINISPIEDYTNIIACHMVSGFMGTLLPPIFGIRDGFNGSVSNNFVHFTWQLLCNVAILGIIAMVFFPLILLLDFCGILRSWEEDVNHRRALFANKTTTPNTIDWRGYPQNLNCMEPEHKAKSTNEEATEPPESVDILFEKKLSLTELPEERKDTFCAADTINTKTSTEKLEIVPSHFVSSDFIPMPTKSNGVKFSNHNSYIVNYVLSTRPMMFFEELKHGPRCSSETTIKDSGDNLIKSSKFIGIKKIQGINNISDSKLFQKFKENWIVPKKRTYRTHDRELRVGSMSNIWTSSDKISFETSV